MDLLWKVSSSAKKFMSQKEETTTEKQDVNKPDDSASFSSGLGNEKPASSLSLETQQGNSDREVSPDSENIDSEPSASPLSKESDRILEGGEEASEAGSIKVGLKAGDLKDASQKAVEQARSFGNFLYGIANKTGRTVSEAAKQVKTTVVENSILSDFNKEQEAFASKSTKSSEECPLPWADTNDEEGVKQQILSLSADRRNFLRSPPTGVMFDFDFDKMQSVAKAMLKEDPALEKMRFEIVPKLINEETFWRNYFYRVSLVKQSSRLNKLSHQKSSSGDSSGSNTEKSSPDSVKDLEKTAAINEGFVDSDATDSPTHEFVSDSFQSSKVSAEDIKHGMKMLGVTDKSSKDDEWEKEMQKELQEYEVVAEGHDDPDWENEIEQMLDDKVKDVV